MAKPTIKFNAVAYDLNGKTGHRPQLESADGVYDLDFCEEVVKEKRLSMSAFELLHAINALGEVGPQKVAEDGRPRGITRLLKYNRYAQGNLDSPTSAWNESCRAYIRPQLMNAAEKIIDATFVNINDGISVKLNFVTYVGAQGVQNVINGGRFGAYGNHMEFDASKGDAAWLETKDGAQRIDLVCTGSDVAKAEFACPAALGALEAGATLTFYMKSRGGVDGGEFHVNKKSVTYLGGAQTTTITRTSQSDRPADTLLLGPDSPFTIVGTDLMLGAGDKVLIELYSESGALCDKGDCTHKVTANTDTEIALSGFAWESNRPDGDWWNVAPNTKIIVVKNGARFEHPVTFIG